MRPATKHFAFLYYLRSNPVTGDRYYVERLGSDGVVILDGRLSLQGKMQMAAEVCRKRGCDGYRVARGPSDAPFTRAFLLNAAVVPVHKEG